MKEPKPIETVTLTFDMYLQAKEEKLTLPKFFYVNCLGDYVFIKTRDRAKAQAFIDEECGAGKYKVRTYTQDGAASGDATCRATETRRGQAKYRNENFGLLYK
jgi:hypothetical protein